LGAKYLIFERETKQCVFATKALKQYIGRSIPTSLRENCPQVQSTLL